MYFFIKPFVIDEEKMVNFMTEEKRNELIKCKKVTFLIDMV